MGDELLPIINKAFVFDFAERYVYLYPLQLCCIRNVCLLCGRSKYTASEEKTPHIRNEKNPTKNRTKKPTKQKPHTKPPQKSQTNTFLEICVVGWDLYIPYKWQSMRLQL